MVREFQITDLERVAEIWLAANVRAHDFIPRQYWEGQLETVRTLFPQAELYVWQDRDGAVQGFVGLSGEHIEGIFVWPPAQSRGVGKALLDRAKAAALERAGLSAAQVVFTHVSMDRDDGRMVYEIEFRQGRVEYEFKIDAATGAILEHEMDPD